MKTVIKQIKLIAAIAMAFSLSACQTLENVYYGVGRTGQAIVGKEKTLVGYNECPPVIAVEELSLIQQYAKNTPPSPLNMLSKAIVTVENQSCTYEEKSVTVDTTLVFKGKLGKKGRLMNVDTPVYSYPFFVAITDRGDKIMTKQLFSAPLYYAEGDEAQYTETLRQIIPIDSQRAGKDYTVMIGFQLSDQQLQLNRDILAAERADVKRDAELERILEQQRNQSPQDTTSPHTDTPINIMPLGNQ